MKIGRKKISKWMMGLEIATILNIRQIVITLPIISTRNMGAIYTWTHKANRKIW